MEQAEFLEFVRRQGTPADEGGGEMNKTALQNATQHRLVVWLMYV